MKSHIFKIFTLPVKTSFFALNALILLHFYSILIHILPFRKIINKSFLNSKKLEHEFNLFELKKIRFIKIIFTKLDQQYPIKFKCLSRSLAASRILSKNNIRHTLYLGITKTNKKMEAHAWVNCEKINVVGGNNNKFHEIASFNIHRKKDQRL